MESHIRDTPVHFMGSAVVLGHMAKSSRNTSPLEAAGDTAGSRAIDAFGILGNKTRLSILLALWETYDPFAEDNAVPFTELRDRVGLPHGSEFNYHLDKLTDQFVRKTGDGYELRHAGLRIVQTVIAGAGLEDPSLEPTAIDSECNLCGAPTALTYEDQLLYVVCTECDGFLGHKDDFPDGAHNAQLLEPAGLTNRSPDEIYKAARAKDRLHNGPLRGVCDVCSGPMTASLDICQNHATEGACPNCEMIQPAVARFQCSVCKRRHLAHPVSLVRLHPVGIAFYWEHGVPLLYEGDVRDMPGYPDRDGSERTDREVISVDPPRVRVTIQLGDDELQATVDGDLAICDVAEPG